MSLKLNGTQQNKNDFLAMISRCMGLEVYLAADGTVTRVAGPPTANNAPFVEEFDSLCSSPNALTMTLGRGQADVILDNFAKRELDLDDLDKLPSPAPAGSPNAFTRCEDLLHIIAEYNHALQQGRAKGGQGFKASHQAGLDAQNRLRAANGQQGTIGPNGQTYNPATGEGTTSYSNGSTTTCTIVDGNITTVTHN